MVPEFLIELIFAKEFLSVQMVVQRSNRPDAGVRTLANPDGGSKIKVS